MAVCGKPVFDCSSATNTVNTSFDDDEEASENDEECTGEEKAIKCDDGDVAFQVFVSYGNGDINVYNGQVNDVDEPSGNPLIITCILG